MIVASLLTATALVVIIVAAGLSRRTRSRDTGNRAAEISGQQAQNRRVEREVLPRPRAAPNGARPLVRPIDPWAEFPEASSLDLEANYDTNHPYWGLHDRD